MSSRDLRKIIVQQEIKGARKAPGIRRQVKDGEVSPWAALDWLLAQEWARPALLSWLRRKARQA